MLWYWRASKSIECKLSHSDETCPDTLSVTILSTPINQRVLVYVDLQNSNGRGASACRRPEERQDLCRHPKWAPHDHERPRSVSIARRVGPDVHRATRLLSPIVRIWRYLSAPGIMLTHSISLTIVYRRHSTTPSLLAAPTALHVLAVPMKLRGGLEEDRQW